jgi:hypothetical protein
MLALRGVGVALVKNVRGMIKLYKNVERRRGIPPTAAPR